MEWLRKVVEMADMGDPDVSLMPEFPGAECKGGAGKRSKSVYYLDPTLSAEQKKERIKTAPRTIGEVLSRDPGWFCLFEKLTQRSLKEGKWLPQGTWVISLRFSVVPGVEPTPLLNTTLLHKVIRCNAALAQEYLPPKGDTVMAVTERDSTVKTFEWRTKENLKVQVTSNTVVITMTPSDP